MGAVGMLIKVGFVFGLLFVTLRFVGKLHNSGSKLSGRRDGAVIQVVGRQSIGRNADVTVVTLGERTLVLGVTEHNVSMVAELDPEDMETREVIEIPTTLSRTGLPQVPSLAPVHAQFENAAAIPARTQAPLSVPSWRDLLESLRERTVRR